MLVLFEKKFLCCEDNFYYLLIINVKKLVECVKYFMYVFEIDEIIYINNIGDFNLYRKLILIEELVMLFFICNNYEEFLCIVYVVLNYLIIFFEII